MQRRFAFTKDRGEDKIHSGSYDMLRKQQMWITDQKDDELDANADCIL